LFFLAFECEFRVWIWILKRHYLPFIGKIPTSKTPLVQENDRSTLIVGWEGRYRGYIRHSTVTIALLILVVAVISIFKYGWSFYHVYVFPVFLLFGFIIHWGNKVVIQIRITCTEISLSYVRLFKLNRISYDLREFKIDIKKDVHFRGSNTYLRISDKKGEEQMKTDWRFKIGDSQIREVYQFYEKCKDKN
jgi:hypothetical protein